VHVAGGGLARRCVRQWPGLAEKLAQAFWPGPLTLVLARAGKIPAAVTAGGGTVGVRWPAHPFMQAVIRECGFPLAAPSANLSNRISPTSAEHVLAQLDGKIPLVVDGGQSQVGIESTVLDLTVSPPRILRPGMIHAESLAAVCGQVASDPGLVEGQEPASDLRPLNSDPRPPILRSPGQLQRHYAPKAKLLVLKWHDDAALKQLVTRHSSLAKCFVVVHTRIPSGFGAANVSVLPHDAAAFARALYAELHRCDAAGAETIVVEAPPELPEWSGIADRLKRAAA
jgi:L-threonylcarbamoyladenylate synthase